MGILSALLTVGGAIIGGPIGASIGGAIGGAVDQSTASNKASKDQERALQAAIAARQTAANQISTVQAPYAGFGAGAVNALGTRLGISPVASPTPFPNAPGGAPPVAANGNALAPGSVGMGAAGPTVPIMPDATGFTSGQDVLNLPSGVQTSGSQVAPDPSTVVNYPPALAAPPPQNALSVNGASPATPAYAVANGTDPGTFGDTTNPTQPGAYSAPKPFSYGLSDYTASPAYQYQQDQARKATLAAASVTGSLQSGAAMKALQDRAQNIAYGDYTGERGFANQLYNTNTTNALNAYTTNQNVYDNNRDYLTNRFDTQTGNLFKGVGVGQTAAGVISNADLNVANGNATSATAVGQAQAQNALSQGQIGSNLANGLVGPVSNALSGLKLPGGIPDPGLPPMPTAGYGY